MRRASFSCSLEGGVVSIFSSGGGGLEDGICVVVVAVVEEVVVLELQLLRRRNTNGRDREEVAMESATTNPIPTFIPTTGVNNEE